LAYRWGSCRDRLHPVFEGGEPEGLKAMALNPCPECQTLVSLNATACPKCGRPYPARKRSSKAAQFGAAWSTVGIGVLIMLGGLALFSNGPGDGVSQEAGGKFMMLGFAIVLMGFWLVAYVAKRKDW